MTMKKGARGVPLWFDSNSLQEMLAARSAASPDRAIVASTILAAPDGPEDSQEPIQKTDAARVLSCHRDALRRGCDRRLAEGQSQNHHRHHHRHLSHVNLPGLLTSRLMLSCLHRALRATPMPSL